MQKKSDKSKKSTDKSRNSKSTNVSRKMTNKEKAAFSEQNRIDMYPVDMNND